MKAALVTFIFPSYFVGLFAETGELQAICPNTRIEAEEGDTVTLPCYLDPEDSVVDGAFDWSRDDKFVYVYRRGQENRNDLMDQHKNRTTVNLEDLSRGILTLQISSVQLSDSGLYKCCLSTPRTSCVVNVTVDHQSKKKHDANTTRPPTDEPGKPDGDNGNLVAMVASTVVGSLFVLVVVLILVLVKCGTIPNPITRFRGKREQKAEMTNGTELNPLRTSSANAGPDPDDSRNNVQVV